ncbi:hypothetical protein ACFL1X_02760, partial [Candidatus Hydrogenedentota bacterium]
MGPFDRPSVGGVSKRPFFAWDPPEQTKSVDEEGKTEMLDFYRAHSSWTDPGIHRVMFKDIPDDISGIVESVQGVSIHGGLLG